MRTYQAAAGPTVIDSTTALAFHGDLIATKSFLVLIHDHYWPIIKIE